MKKFPGSQFIKQVIELFREESSTPPTSQLDKPWSKIGLQSSEESAQKPGNFSKNLPSDKARESNIDRYKHPSDFSSGYWWHSEWISYLTNGPVSFE